MGWDVKFSSEIGVTNDANDDGMMGWGVVWCDLVSKVGDGVEGRGGKRNEMEYIWMFSAVRDNLYE